MNPQAQFCPSEACPARGRGNEGNIGVHSRKDKLYMCHECKKTFAESRGTMFHGLRVIPLSAGDNSVLVIKE